MDMHDDIDLWGCGHVGVHEVVLCYFRWFRSGLECGGFMLAFDLFCFIIFF